MDAARGLKLFKCKKGLALIYVALLMVAICAMAGLAIDVGYMYVTRGQLQNAADSAALAGASRLIPGALAQPDARSEAVSYAGKNRAAAKEISISSDGSNILSADNDVTVGNWNAALNPQYSALRVPVNAVQVRARRTGSTDPSGASNDGPVDLFFAQVVAPRWSQMGASAGAIAQRIPKAGFYFIIGRLVCESTGTVALSPGLGNMAWTSLLENSTSASDVKNNYICPENKLPDVEVCGEQVYTSNGTANTIFQAVETDFYDPEYDSLNKTYAPDGSVSTWTIIVPVSVVADPSVQPSPQDVWGYGKIVITRACGNGNGSPCSGRSFMSTGACGGGEDDIVISSITCVDCANSSEMIGARPSLVQ